MLKAAFYVELIHREEKLIFNVASSNQLWNKNVLIFPIHKQNPNPEWFLCRPTVGFSGVCNNSKCNLKLLKKF